jgi:hypothetical protein
LKIEKGLMESGKGADIRERAFEFACRVLELHRFVYKADPALRDTSRQASSAAKTGRVDALIAEATEIVAILTTIVKKSRNRT